MFYPVLSLLKVLYYALTIGHGRPFHWVPVLGHSERKKERKKEREREPNLRMCWRVTDNIDVCRFLNREFMNLFNCDGLHTGLSC